jgi:hypothetical protein
MRKLRHREFRGLPKLIQKSKNRIETPNGQTTSSFAPHDELDPNVLTQHHFLNALTMIDPFEDGANRCLLWQSVLELGQGF